MKQLSFDSISSVNVIAQPAVPVNDDRTDLLGILPFWAKASVNPLFLWEHWIGQFFLANDNIRTFYLNPHGSSMIPLRNQRQFSLEKMLGRPVLESSEIKRRLEEKTSILWNGGEKALESARTGSITKLRPI